MAQGEGGGRPPHEPTEAKKVFVKELISCGITQEKIAQRLNITPETLRKHYQYELDTGKTDVIHKIGGGLVSKAIDDKDLGAMIFYLKTQGGWKENKDDPANQALSVIEQFMKMQKQNV